MRRNRRNYHTAFSMFAFQDIITSVTGICIFVTLVLVLQWINAPAQATTQDESAEEKVDQVSADIAKARDQLQQAHASLAQQAQTSSDAFNFTPGELTAELQQMRSYQLELESESDALREQQLQIEQTHHELLTLERQAEDTHALQAIQQQLDDLREQTAQLEKDKSLVYTAVPGSTRLPWIVDISHNGLSIHRPDEPRRKVTFPRADPLTQLTRFREWSASRDPSREYFMLVVRPSGIDTYRLLLASLIADEFNYGIDLIDENANIRIQASRENKP